MQGMVEVPYLVVQSVVYACLVYWMIGFQTDAGRQWWGGCWLW